MIDYPDEIVRSAVDGDGEVTSPGYPERTGEAAVAFHRDRLETLLWRSRDPTPARSGPKRPLPAS